MRAHDRSDVETKSAGSRLAVLSSGVVTVGDAPGRRVQMKKVDIAAIEAARRG